MTGAPNREGDQTSSKVPEVTLTFWIIKVAATTLGETAGDAVSMSMNLGYLVGTGIFAALFVGAVLLQISAKRFHPALYWTTIIASTTVGTTLADFTDRSLGVGYAGGATLLFTLLLLVASNVLAVVICVAFAVAAGWLFWKLIRVMGRLQAPQRVR